MYNNYPLYYGASIRCVMMTADHAHYTPAIYMKTAAAAAKGLSNNQLRIYEPDYQATLNQMRLDLKFYKKIKSYSLLSCMVLSGRQLHLAIII